MAYSVLVARKENYYRIINLTEDRFEIMIIYGWRRGIKKRKTNENI